MADAVMTPLEFLGALEVLRWSAGAVSFWCGYSRQLGAAWLHGERKIPEPVAGWLDARMAGVLVDPPQVGPRFRKLQ